MNKIMKGFMALMISLSLCYVNSNKVEASSCADKLVSVAMAEKGNGYKTKYGSAYGGSRNAWCASFVTWAARQADIPKNVIPSTASAYGMYSGVKNNGGKVVSSPQKGDLVFYKKSSSDSSICHVGIMTSSSMSIQGNYSNQVKYMDPYDYRLGKGKPPISRNRVIFVRPNYGKASVSESTNTNTNTNTNTSNNTTSNNSTAKPTVKPTVVKTSISKFTVKGIESKVDYTSKAIKPTITLYNGSKKIDSKNYTVTYKNNTNPGKATITIKGKNDYTGTITKTFTILEVDYSKLKAAKASVPLDLSIYTEETLETLNTAITNANNLKSTSVQKTVDNATSSLTSAIEHLVIKPADYSALDAVITQVPADLSDYTKDSVEALNNAINAVVRDKLITEQQLVDTMALDIETALSNLELNPFRSEVVIPVALGSSLVCVIGYILNKRKSKETTKAAM